MVELSDVIEMIKNKFAPASIFLYGSQATNTATENSDYELGVVFEDYKYYSRRQIKEKISYNNFSIFPFKKSEFESLEIDTPFQKNIYVYSLVNGGAKTVYGERFVENIKVPKISRMDLLMDTSFNLGVALASFQSLRKGDIKLSQEQLYKSFFFTLRNYILLNGGKFVNGYINIYNEAKKLTLPQEYQPLIEYCKGVRTGEVRDVDSSMVFKNISFTNKVVIPLIQEQMYKKSQG